MQLSNFNERHCYVNYLKDNPFLFIEAATVVEPDPEYGYFTGAMVMTTFEYIQTGYGYISYKDRKYKLSPGDCCIMQGGGKPYKFWSDKEKPYRKLWFSGQGKFLDTMLDLYDIKDDITILRAPQVEPIFKRIIDELYRTGYDEHSMTATINDLIWILKRQGMNKGDNRLSSQIHKKISKDYHKITCVSDLASLYRISEKQLTRVFKADYGVTPWAYVIECRLNSAADKLRDGSAKTIDIAYACGYKSVWHFEREFRKKFGVTPTEYRLGNRQSDTGGEKK